MASAVADFMRGQHINCASILGHSMGGKVAMQFACDYPQQVAKLLVVDIAPKIYPPHHQEILAALLDLDLSSFTSRQQIDKVLAQHIPQLALRQFLLTNLYKNQQGGFSWRFHLANIVNNYTHICAAPSLRQPYSGPSLFIRGEQSNYIRPADSTVITQHFPQVQIVSLANAGHWLHVEQPVDFLAQVTGFIG
jgi:pimeloyl-ACP methyl ester carboxylesterase